MVEREDHMRSRNITWLVAALGALGGTYPALAQSPSHAYINTLRSAHETHYFVSIGATGLNGDISVKSATHPDDRAATAWQGYGIRNEVGIEYLKFLQFGIAHNSLNMRTSRDSSINMVGSRFEGNGSLNFYSPLGNLQMGGGFIGSRMELRDRNASSGYYGSGYFYNLGYNYFLSSIVSVYIDARKSQENLVRTSGGELPASMKTNLSEAGIGFKLWL
jgi:hypothetical protein